MVGLNSHKCLQLSIPIPVLQYQKYLSDRELHNVREQICLKINFSPQVTLSHMWSQIWDCARMGVYSW